MEGCKFFLILKHLIKQLNDENSTSLPRKNSGAGAKYFPKLIVSLGYWKVKVDKESSNLEAFGTSIGRFHFKTISLWYTLCQWRFLENGFVNNIQHSQWLNFSGWHSDMGKTLAEHNNCLQKVLLKVKESGLKLNKNKCHFCK